MKKKSFMRSRRKRIKSQDFSNTLMKITGVLFSFGNMLRENSK